MKLKDLILEARIFQNNFIKVGMVEEELDRLFDGDEKPNIEFDTDGMFIRMDNFVYRTYEQEGGFNKFSLTDTGVVDPVKNVRKYYVEFVKAPKTPAAPSTEEAQ